MKVSKRWLEEIIKQPLTVTASELSNQLTMAGLEVESVAPIKPIDTKVVVAEIVDMQPHPNAKKLNICTVNVGDNDLLTIVCGAENARKGLKIAAALVGSVLPNGMAIEKADLRGIESSGMLCSAKELGLADDAAGIWELPTNSPVGETINQYLSLDDDVLDISITPNRGDCLSMLGIAREVATILGLEQPNFNAKVCKPMHKATKKITIEAPVACPRYMGCSVTGLSVDRSTPIAIQERLRRAGLRTVSPVVDILNYVMLECGQPLHAFDTDAISGNICVRYAREKESLKLLTEHILELNQASLVISDDQQVLALAGIMGGYISRVTEKTQSIFIESAFFTPEIIARTAKYYQLQTDAAYRYERGVDFELPEKAMYRAIELLTEILGGEVGEIIECTASSHLPNHTDCTVSLDHINEMLGLALSTSEVGHLLQRMGIVFTQSKDNKSFDITIPSYRYDLKIEEDIIEEIARIYGYEQIQPQSYQPSTPIRYKYADFKSEALVKRILTSFGYHEAVTYNFIDPKLHQQFGVDQQNIIPLRNPIASDMADMRCSLWPGLISALIYNQHRQQARVRLFEVGRVYHVIDGKHKEKTLISGLVSGFRYPEQWGVKNTSVDFYDVKGDLERLIQLFHPGAQCEWVAEKNHAALHPGQAAHIVVDQKNIGLLGALHPNVSKKLGCNGAVYVFELDYQCLISMGQPRFQSISKFPSVRRDFAWLIPVDMEVGCLLNRVKELAKEWLQDCILFDIFLDSSLPEGRKSVAVGIVLQHLERTLQEDEVQELSDLIVNTARQEFDAVLRDQKS